MAHDCDAEYLGFNNRTCSTKISPSSTAGPVMRGQSESMMWREWMVRVENQQDENEGYKTISLQAFIRPDVEDEARCLGFVSTFYGNSDFACDSPPYGGALFLNSSRDDSKDSSEMWKIRQVDGTAGQFEIVASNKPDACPRVMAVEGCSGQPALIENSPPYVTESTKYRSWTFVKRYDLVPKASPPPPPPPPPLPPVGPAPGPVISAPTSATLAYVVVKIDNFGGDDGCSISSITLTSRGVAAGSVPQTVEVSVTLPGLSSNGVQVPLTKNGYNSVYAVGTCSNGEKTDWSNELFVFYTKPGPSGEPIPSPIPSPIAPPMEWKLGQLGESCTVVCNNVGGTCNYQAQRNIITLNQIKYVMNELGASGTEYYEDQDVYQELPGIWYLAPARRQVGYSAALSDCGHQNAAVRRICCCGTSAECPLS